MAKIESQQALLEDPVLNGSPCASDLLESSNLNLICNVRGTLLIYGAKAVEASVRQEGVRADDQFSGSGTQKIAAIGDILEVESMTLRVSSNSETICLYMDLKQEGELFKWGRGRPGVGSIHFKVDISTTERRKDKRPNFKMTKGLE